jgi:hypothetical protein
MNESSITQYITTAFVNVEITNAFGYTFFFYGADHTLPFVTLANADNEHDRVSNLDRPDVFRLNIGVGKQTFQSLFGTGRIDVSTYNFTALDTIMPHPDYAAQSWLCVLNPSDTTFQILQPLLAEAYERAVQRYNRRNARS